MTYYVYSNHPLISSNIQDTCSISELEPVSYHQACKYDNWRKSLQEELQALTKNDTLDCVKSLRSMRTIPCKWIYKTKRNAYGSVSKFKVRLMAKEFMQIYGMDYNDSFASVSKVVTVRHLPALAANKRWLFIK